MTTTPSSSPSPGDTVRGTGEICVPAVGVCKLAVQLPTALQYVLNILEVVQMVLHHHLCILNGCPPANEVKWNL